MQKSIVVNFATMATFYMILILLLTKRFLYAIFIYIAMLPFFKSRDTLGIDIGSSTIKIIQLKGSTHKYSLVHEGIISIPEAETDINLAEKRNLLVKELKNYIIKNRLTGKNAVTSVSGSSVIVRYVKLPKTTKEDLSKNIFFEAEPYIPFDIREVNLGFYILGDTIEEGERKTEVVIVAAKKDLVQTKMNILIEAGLQPTVVDVDAFALESSYEITAEKPITETVIFVNIGANVTNMSILENGVSKVVRDIFISGNSLTKALQKNLQCNFKTAEELKCKYGILVTAEQKEKALTTDSQEALQVSNIITPILRDLLNEVHRSVDFYYSQKGEQAVINKVILSGGSANLLNIDKYFSQELKLPTEIANPLAKVDNAAEVEPSRLPALSIAVGLALRTAKDTK